MIPHLYEEHGAAFVERLDGMFAIALWDGPRERLVLARDRLGKKPLVWTRLPDGTLAFASELKALLRLPGLCASRRPRRRSTPTSRSSTSPATRTALRGVQKLPPGHVLVAEGDGGAIERYWRAEPADRERRRAGVARARARDGATPPCASGSSPTSRSARCSPAGSTRAIVVALMAQASRGAGAHVHGRLRRRRATTSARYARARRRALRHASTRRSCVEPDVAATLPRLAAAFDEPLGDEAALPLFLICEPARRHVTVALVGDGGDESFAGYERYAAHRARRAHSVAGARRAARSGAARSAGGAARAALAANRARALPRRRPRRRAPSATAR